MSSLSFNREVAIETNSVMLAILLEYFYSSHIKNTANTENYVDGHFWSYTTIEQLEAEYPFWTKNIILKGIRSLQAKEYLIEKKEKKDTYYALTDPAIAIMRGFDPYDYSTANNTDQKVIAKRTSQIKAMRIVKIADISDYFYMEARNRAVILDIEIDPVKMKNQLMIFLNYNTKKRISEDEIQMTKKTGYKRTVLAWISKNIFNMKKEIPHAL